MTEQPVTTTFLPFYPPDPIPLSRAGPQRRGQSKLAFYPGHHPPFMGIVNEQFPNQDALAMTDQDNTQWAGAYRGFTQYPREISANDRPTHLAGATDSVTEFVWGMYGNPVGREPLSSRLPKANFFASDPQQFKSNGGGFLAGCHGGGVSLDGMTPSGAWSFLTQGTKVIQAVYRQNYYGPVNPTMTTKDLQASSIYNPLPAFGVITPKLP